MVEVAIRGNQPSQHNFLEDMAPGWSLYQAGLGAGKTWAGARKFLLLHAINQCPGLIVAPTLGDLWRFAVPEIKAACAEWGWDCTVYPKGRGEYQYPFMIIWGQIIYLISTEDPRRFSGFEVGHIWIDEAAKIKQNHIDPTRDAITQIRGRLRHKTAKVLHALCTTTPEGTETWIQDYFFDDVRDNHRKYIGDTEQNAALPQEFIDDLKSSLPGHLLDQYLKGIAASVIAGIAHPTFSRALHVTERADWAKDPKGNKLQVLTHIGQDYNVQPMFWVAIQQIGDVFNIVDEMYIPDYALVDNGMQQAHAQGWGETPVRFHPDKSSGNRKTTGDPEFTVVQKEARRLGWNFSGTAQGANPPVNSRLNLVSRLLLDGLGKTHLFVHPRCVHVIEDFERTTRKQSGYESGAKGLRGHGLDGTGYTFWDVVAPQGHIQVGSFG